MTKKPLTWCGVEVTEEEYERLAQEYLRAFVDAEFVEFVSLTEDADVVLVVSEPARVGRIEP